MEGSILEGGRYHAADAARLVGVPGDRIGQWARWGHIPASVSAREPHVYSWGDVAEALAVHVLLHGGVPLPAVRRAVDALGGRWPLSRAGVHLVDGRIAVERAAGLEDVATRQRILASPADTRRRGARRAGGVGAIPPPGERYGANGSADVAPVEVWLTVDAPGRLARGGWTATDAVAVDPARLGGGPCVRGTRVAVADLAAAPGEDLGVDPVLRDAALAWWAASDPGTPGAPVEHPRTREPAAGAGRALVLDAGLPAALTAELRARGREAYPIPGALADADVAALDGVVVTTDRATWARCRRAVLVAPGATGRDAVHRHAHELPALRGRRRLR